METKINVHKKPKLKNPILIEGLPGIGNVGRVCAGYILDQLGAKKMADIVSHYFLPLIVLDDNSEGHLLKNSFYYYKRKGKADLVIVTGDTQSVSGEGHYEVSKKIIDFAKKIGVKKVITIGGFSTDKEPEKPEVIGAVSDKKLVKKYKKHGVSFEKEKPVGTIVGASGLLMGMAKEEGMEGLTLMGETMGFPLITDPKAADAVLKVLAKVLDLDIDLEKLEKAVKDMEKQIKKTEKIHRQMMKSQKKSDETMKYIG